MAAAIASTHPSSASSMPPSPGIGAGTPDGTESGSHPGASGSSQRRTSWREWGTSFSSWASTSSPFRQSNRPSSSSSNSTSTFSFGPSALAKSRADVVHLPPSELTQRLIEADSEPVLMEGERLRLPPTPAELEALEEAGVQDEEDLRLEREERERVRSMPPPPRHPSVFSRFSNRGSGRFTPRSSPLLEQERETLPPIPTNGTASPHAGHSDQAGPEPLGSPMSLPPVPLDEDLTPRRADFSKLADLPEPPVTARSDLSEVNLSSPPPAPVIPSVMISSATSQSLAEQIGLQSPLDRDEQSSEHDDNSELNKDQTGGHPVQQPRILGLGREAPVRAEEEVQGSHLESESEAESAKEDLIPSDLYDDSDAEDDDDALNTQSSPGADLSENDGKRQSRGPHDRFSLLLSNLSRPITEEKDSNDDDEAIASAVEPAKATEGQTTLESQDKSATSEEARNSAPAAASNASAASEYAASSASSYQGTDDEEPNAENESIDGAHDTTVIFDPETSQYRSMSVEDPGTESPQDSEPALLVNHGDEHGSLPSHPNDLPSSLDQHGSHTPTSASLPEASTASTDSKSTSYRNSLSSTSHETAPKANVMSLSEELSAVAQKEDPDLSENTPEPRRESSAQENVSVETTEEGRALQPAIIDNHKLSEVGTISPPTQAEETAADTGTTVQDPDADDGAESLSKTTADTSQTGLPESVTTQSFVSFSQSSSDIHETAPEGGDDEGVSTAAKSLERAVTRPDSPEAEASASDRVNGLVSTDDEIHVPDNQVDEAKPDSGAVNDSDVLDGAGDQSAHDRLRDVLGLGRPESPAQSLTSASSFASALSEEEDRQISTDNDGTLSEAEDVAAVQDAAIPTELTSDTRLQLPASEPSVLVSDDGEVHTPTAEEIAVLGSPMKQSDDTTHDEGNVVPESAVAQQDQDADGATDENTPTPSQGEFTARTEKTEGESAKSGPTTPLVDAQSPLPTLSPNPMRPARNRNRGRKGPAPTPPSASPVSATDKAAIPVTTRVDSTNPISTADASDAEISAVSEPSSEAEQTAEAPSTPAVAPPSRPPRGRPPRAKGHVAALSKESAVLATSEPSTPEPEAQFATYPDAATAESSPMVSSPPTPLTPGGSKKKVQRKAVPTVQ